MRFERPQATSHKSSQSSKPQLCFLQAKRKDRNRADSGRNIGKRDLSLFLSGIPLVKEDRLSSDQSAFSAVLDPNPVHWCPSTYCVRYGPRASPCQPSFFTRQERKPAPTWTRIGHSCGRYQPYGVGWIISLIVEQSGSLRSCERPRGQSRLRACCTGMSVCHSLQ